jgi:MtaA/CmuA family methyltransferase
MADMAIEIGKKQIDAGTHGIMMEDPSAAAQVISPEHYREFAYPYERKVALELNRYGGDVIIHICGDTTPILPDLAKTGAKCLSVDESVALGLASETLGGGIALFGNVPVDIIYKGSLEEIKASVRKCVDSTPLNGYILSSSCGLHSRTPFQNLQALVDFAIKYKSSGKQ